MFKRMLTIWGQQAADNVLNLPILAKTRDKMERTEWRAKRACHECVGLSSSRTASMFV